MPVASREGCLTHRAIEDALSELGASRKFIDEAIIQDAIARAAAGLDDAVKDEYPKPPLDEPVELLANLFAYRGAHSLGFALPTEADKYLSRYLDFFDEVADKVIPGEDLLRIASRMSEALQRKES